MFADPSGQSSGSRSAGLTLNLSSNNPFRNRAASPNSIGSNQFSPPPPHSPFDDPPPRPTSRNPFLDPNNNNNSGNSNSFPAQQPSVKSPGSMSSTNDKSATAFAEDLFNSLSLEDKAAQKTPSLQPSNRPPPPPSRSSRGENGPPPRGRGPPPRGAPHRPTRSQEEAQRAARTHGGSGSLGGEKMFNSSDKRPERRPERRPRRNSDTSIIEKPMTEEEKKAREIRRRERERRHREGKDSKDKPKGKRLDLIDQLDATSIYGTGLFHHDGPFDALNPHRNRGGTRRAPMEAFPEGSLNNSLGGSGPINTRPDHATFMGNHDEEGFREWSGTGKDRNGYVAPDSKAEGGFFDPTSRGSMLHGDSSMGLGTSTFLEGAPAARADIQRRQAELAAQEQGGLQRKKSLAQRFRGMNRERPSRDYAGARMTNPEGAYGPRSGDLPTSSSTGERNPFFDDFDKGGGEERISVKRSEAMSPGSAGGNSPPRGYNLERRTTSEQLGQASPTDGTAKPQGGGFLSRVKSLKGGRRQRPEIPNQPPPVNNAGTAV